MYSQTARFAGLKRWDVKQLRTLSWPQESRLLEPLARLAVRRSQPAPSAAPLGSISFNGSVTLRAGDRSIRGRTYLARSGDLVFSKIDARNGAIGIVPPSIDQLAFSSEYPIFDLTYVGALLPQYAALLLRTPIFLSQVEGLAAGHSGRKRVTPEDFLSLRVPVPDEDVQRSIVAEYEEKLESAMDRIGEVENIVPQASAEILDLLGISLDLRPSVGTRFTVQFSKLSTWSVRRTRSDLSGLSDELMCGYPVSRLGDPTVAAILRGVSKSPRNRPNRNARPYLRVANLQAGFIDLSDVRTIDVPEDAFESVRLHLDDVLVCRNNSLELVGKAALWRGQIGECTHDDHIFRVRVVGDTVTPRYLEAYINTPYAQAWLQSRAQVTTNLAGIPGSALADLPIPIPDHAVQLKVESLYQTALDTYAATVDQAYQTLEKARSLAASKVSSVKPRTLR
ncbi:hypothetical protein KBX03_09550 [Micromonospora sp. C72]|uniref:restriction endonuclease subunit S n=1 Tax=Micromonospora sp. C72 TaxID=2824880 RepID=UPI001B398513|nr:hypothetical protein [Micromonospora sp. C72]MBQ1042752.1 hypothetical protein [Micromonospora sp. C72]